MVASSRPCGEGATREIGFHELRFAPLDAHPDGGTGDGIFVDLLFPVYAPDRDGEGTLRYEPGLLEIPCDQNPRFVPMRSYAARRIYRKLMRVGCLAASIAFAAMMLCIFFFAVRNGNPFVGESPEGVEVHVWQSRPVVFTFACMAGALVAWLLVAVLSEAHKTARIEAPVTMPAELGAELRRMLRRISSVRRSGAPEHIRQSRPGKEGAGAAGGVGGDLLTLAIDFGYDLRDDRARARWAAEARRAVAEALLGVVESFGSARIDVSEEQFRYGGSLLADSD